MTLLFQFVCPTAKELEQMTMKEFVNQAIDNSMYVGVLDFAVPTINNDGLVMGVLNEPTFEELSKGGLLIIEKLGGSIVEKSIGSMVYPFVNVTMQGVPYSNGQVLTFSVRPVKLKDSTGVTKSIVLNTPEDC